ncbi:MAG: hypothetical protein HQ541_16250 [Mariniphaga sp.]|nr:hypothetical protein [Mariniphaga sp.]
MTSVDGTPGLNEMKSVGASNKENLNVLLPYNREQRVGANVDMDRERGCNEMKSVNGSMNKRVSMCWYQKCMSRSAL